MQIRRRIVLVATAVALLGCTPTPPPDTAIMPLTGAGTPVMSDTGAIGLASYVLGGRSRYDGHPVDAARALAAVDYLAGALYSNPHWIGIPALSKLRMLQARQEIRQVLGVAPDASSQKVVSGLLAAADAIAGQDEAAARRALPSSVFALGPDRTLALLSDLPSLPVASGAAQYLNSDTNSNCAFSTNCG